MKPIIIAICGKSSTGKDTLAKALFDWAKSNQEDTKLIVSDTTRPMRKNEQNGKNYYYITKEVFEEEIAENVYLEYSKFRGWYYGIPKDRLNAQINICVLNPQGIKTLSQMQDEYNVIPVWLESNWGVRLGRSIEREGKFKPEYLRRMFTDWKDFLNFEHVINQFSRNLHIDANNTAYVVFVNTVNSLLDMGIIL